MFSSVVFPVLECLVAVYRDRWMNEELVLLGSSFRLDGTMGAKSQRPGGSGVKAGGIVASCRGWRFLTGVSEKDVNCNDCNCQ